MKINNINTLTYGATLLDRDIENSEVVTYDDWLDDAFSPITHKQVFKFSYVKCDFLIEQPTDEEAEKTISNIIKDSSIAELLFDDLDRTYKGVLDEKSKSKITIGKYDLTLKWKCGYSFKNEQDIIMDTAIKTVNIDGNIKTPVIVEVTPTVDVIDIQLTGLGEDIKLSNLTTGNMVVIDSENGKVTQNQENKFADYDSWNFPYLVPGENTITIDNSSVNVTIKYKSRYI